VVQARKYATELFDTADEDRSGSVSEATRLPLYLFDALPFCPPCRSGPCGGSVCVCWREKQPPSPCCALSCLARALHLRRTWLSPWRQITFGEFVVYANLHEEILAPLLSPPAQPVPARGQALPFLNIGVPASGGGASADSLLRIPQLFTQIGFGSKRLAGCSCRACAGLLLGAWDFVWYHAMPRVLERDSRVGQSGRGDLALPVEPWLQEPWWRCRALRSGPGAP
jgi:hypothetical protein